MILIALVKNSWCWGGDHIVDREILQIQSTQGLYLLKTVNIKRESKVYFQNILIL